MYSLVFSFLFIAFLIFSTLVLRFWLSNRNMCATCSPTAPRCRAEFSAKIPLAAHQKAADYTVAKTRFGLISLLFSSAVLIGFTLMGGLQWLAIGSWLPIDRFRA